MGYFESKALAFSGEAHFLLHFTSGKTELKIVEVNGVKGLFAVLL